MHSTVVWIWGSREGPAGRDKMHDLDSLLILILWLLTHLLRQ